MQKDPLHFAQVRPLPIVKESFALAGLFQQVPVRRSGEKVVRKPFEGRELIGAPLGRACRHQGFGVPLQDADRILNGSETGETRLESAVGMHGVFSGRPTRSLEHRTENWDPLSD